MSIEFENEDINKRIVNACIKNGVITDWFLFDQSSMRIAPPLTITTEEIEKASSIIIQSIDACLT